MEDTVPIGFIYAVLILTVVVIAVVVVHPAVTVGPRGKNPAFLVLFVFPLLAVVRSYQHHMDGSLHANELLSLLSRDGAGHPTLPIQEV